MEEVLAKVAGLASAGATVGATLAGLFGASLMVPALIGGGVTLLGYAVIDFLND